MKTPLLTESYNQVLVQRNVFCVVAVTSMIVNLFLGGINYYLVGKERIVVTPPVINQEFWVASSTVSESYLQQMADYFVGLVLNVSPGTFSTREQQLLKYVHPADYSTVKSGLVAQRVEVERRGLSSNFHPLSFQIDKKNKIVQVRGELRIHVGSASLEIKMATYQIQFMQDQGRLYIKALKEIKSEG